MLHEEGQGPDSAHRITRAELRKDQNLMLREASNYGNMAIRAKERGMRQPLRRGAVMRQAKSYRRAALRWHRRWELRRKQGGNPPRNRAAEEFRRSANPVGAVIQAAKALGHAVSSGDREMERAMIQELLNRGESYARGGRKQAETARGKPS